ncbi:MAG: hypothetical protein ACKOZU_06075 [Planctomycetaceae bacterium]
MRPVTSWAPALLAVVAFLPQAAADDAPATAATALGAAAARIVKDATGTITEVRFGRTAPAEALAALPALPGLKSVVLAGRDAEDSAVAAVAKVTGLRSLDVSECSQIDDDAGFQSRGDWATRSRVIRVTLEPQARSAPWSGCLATGLRRRSTGRIPVARRPGHETR